MWLLLISLVIIIYILFQLTKWFATSNDDYWRKRQVPRVLITDLTNYFNFLTGKTSLQDLDLQAYRKYPDAPFIGLMEFRSPVVMIRDLEILKKIFIKDFDHFVNRRTFPLGDPISDSMLFNMKNQEWKECRTVMTPTFTTGKIRIMFEHLQKSGENLVKYVEKEAGKSGSRDFTLRELFSRYTMDVIASTAFGVQSDCLTSDNPMFYQMGKKFQAFNIPRTVKTILAVMLPKLFAFLNLSIFDRECLSFFKAVVQRALMERRASNSKSHSDFLQIMLEAVDKSGSKTVENSKDSNKDLFERDAELNVESTGNQKKLTDQVILANSVSFLFAGFDTTESLLSLTSYQLAIHPEVQERLRKEVEDVLEEFDGKVTYDSVNKMNYLDMVVSEVLRLYPPSVRTERRVSKPYRIPNSNVILPVDMLVAIPIRGIQNDPKYYPEPEKFDPERFSPENKQARNPYAYMPFGHGPRNCIGMRFAMAETKAAIAHLVKNFDITPCADTCIPLQFENVAGALKPSKDLKLALNLR